MDALSNGDVNPQQIETDPIAFAAVENYMIHGPCGDANRNSPCMHKGKCQKHFPKNFLTTTTVDDEGYLLYRRRDTGAFIEKTGVKLNNQYVVPYNRNLLIKFDAHINTEILNQHRSIKYLFKYINKESDILTISVQRNTNGEANSESTNSGMIDEITAYLDCRYISAIEACWRIFKFDMYYREPAVERLPFHLENEQTVIFDPDNYIRTVNGVIHLTFKEACYALGLLDDDKEWHDYLDEASVWVSRNQLRQLFVMIILFNEVVSPRDLWRRNAIKLSEDIAYILKRKMGMQAVKLIDEQLQNHALIEIEDLIRKGGKKITDFHGIPIPNCSQFESTQDRLIAEEMSYDIESNIKLHDKLYSGLNQGQQKIYDSIIRSVEDKKGTTFFVYGHGGIGMLMFFLSLGEYHGIETYRNMRLKSSNNGTIDLDDLISFDIWFLEIREETNESADEVLIEIPDDLYLHEDCNPQETIVNIVFPRLCEQVTNDEYMRETTILTVKNETVHELHE
ncbi:uncharacterized protein LOC116137522 [Pistacia vera]|uniref:uncharacterized protein LOC116137522 n=1 Tax=Pistacia vera TaxID=55513 RepID=UPI0012635F21|nr:uncharacterized protein LOC116137522 [Pistacia vera]